MDIILEVKSEMLRRFDYGKLTARAKSMGLTHSTVA